MRNLLVAILVLSSFNSFANVPLSTHDKKLLIKSVDVKEVANPVSIGNKGTVFELPTNPGGASASLDEISIIIDKILAIGKKIWPIIDANRPVITNRLAQSISIIPHVDGEKPELYEMANWSRPTARSYRVSYKNYFGSEVIAFTFTVYFQHHGTYQDSGRYITSLKVVASEIYAGWGFNFDAVSELVSIANVGSQESPVASGIVQVSYKVRGLMNEMQNAQTFYVDGLGNLEVLK